jgi:hypothetical protein
MNTRIKEKLNMDKNKLLFEFHPPSKLRCNLTNKLQVHGMGPLTSIDYLSSTGLYLLMNLILISWRKLKKVFGC